MIILALLAIGLSGGTAAAQEPVVVKSIKTGPNGKIAVFDGKGAKIGELAPDAFPKPPFPAAEYNPRTRYVKVTAGGQEVWLTPIQVTTSEQAGVLSACEAAERVAGAGTDKGTAYTSRGISSKCSN
jgi:hypothetical protein